MKHPLINDTEIGQTTTVEFDEQAGKMVIESTANVGDQIEHNKRAVNSDDHHEIPGLGQRIAHIPPTVGLYWLYNYGVDVWSGDPDQRRAVMVLLNQPEWAFLRTNSWDLGTKQRTYYDGGSNV